MPRFWYTHIPLPRSHPELRDIRKKTLDSLKLMAIKKPSNYTNLGRRFDRSRSDWQKKSMVFGGFIVRESLH